MYYACKEKPDGSIGTLTDAVDARTALKACYDLAGEAMTDGKLNGLADYAASLDVERQFVTSHGDDRLLLVRAPVKTDILDVLNERMNGGEGCLIEFTYEEAQALQTELLRGRTIEDAGRATYEDADQMINGVCDALRDNPRPKGEAS